MFRGGPGGLGRPRFLTLPAATWARRPWTRAALTRLGGVVAGHHTPGPFLRRRVTGGQFRASGREILGHADARRVAGKGPIEARRLPGVANPQADAGSGRFHLLLEYGIPTAR